MMSRSTPPSARSPRPRGDARAGSWALSGAIWFTLVAATAGLDRMLVGIDWLTMVAIASAALFVASASARSRRAHPVLPPLLALLVAVAAVTLLYLPRDAFLSVVPTPASWTQVQEVAGLGFDSIAQQGLPAVADTGISFLLVSGVLALAWLCDVCAFSIRLPAFVGLPVLALIAVPVLIDPSDVSWLSLVLAGAGYASVLAFSSGFLQYSGRRSRAARPSAGLGATALVLVVIGIAAVVAGAMPGYVRSPLSSGASGTVFNGSVDPVVALGADLRRPDPATVLVYSTTSAAPVYLRVLSIADFSGQNWAPSDPGTGESIALDEISAPSEPGAEVVRTVDDVSVSIETLRSRWLPVPAPLQAVTGVSDSWRQSVEDGSVSGNATTQRGDQYDAQAVALSPTVDQLAASVPVGAGLDRYLALPDGVPEIVANTAAQVTADSRTPYDKALALQKFFRSSAFTYSEDTPAEQGYDGDGVGVLADFLETKAGYCVHFASAMTVMAREQGIPARLAIGYQPGTRTASVSDSPSYQVSSSDLHAWPELYFDGVGWLRFEPTPGRGSPASYSLPASVPGSPGGTASGTASASPESSPTPSSVVTPTATSSSTAGGSSSSLARQESWLGVLWIVLAVIVLLLPSTIRAVQRARRRAGASPEGVWSEVVATARDLGLSIDDGDSPRAIQAELTQAMGDAPASTQALAALTHTVERERFAPRPDAETLLWESRAPIIESLQIGAGPGRRVLGSVFPRSIVHASIRRRSSHL